MRVKLATLLWNIFSPLLRRCVFPSSVVTEKRLALCLLRPSPHEISLDNQLSASRRCASNLYRCLLLHHKVICFTFYKALHSQEKGFTAKYIDKCFYVAANRRYRVFHIWSYTNPYPVGGSGRKLVKFDRKLVWSINWRSSVPLRAVPKAVSAALQCCWPTGCCITCWLPCHLHKTWADVRQCVSSGNACWLVNGA
jgi:hypothetical protein